MRAATLVAAILTFLVVPMSTPPNASALTKDEIECVDEIADESREFVDAKLEAIVDCNNKIAEDGSCNTTKRDRKIGKAEAELTRTLERKCDVTLENLGFPGGCGDNTGGTFTSEDLGACLAERLEATVDAIIAINYPALAQFDEKEARCQEAIGNAGETFVNRKLRARSRCAVLQAIGKISSSVDCLAEVPPGTGDDKTDELIEEAVDRVDERLKRACRGANLETLGFPGSCTDSTGGDFTAKDAAECIATTNEVEVDAVVATMFPFLAPAPTPTETPGAPVATATITGDGISTTTPSGTPSSSPSLEPGTASPAPEVTPTATEPGPVETATEPGPIETATEPVPVETATEPAPVETATEPGPVVTPTATEPGPAETATATEPVPVETATEVPVPTVTSTPGPSGTCPTLITFEGTSTTGVLDTGWTGLGHDATVISEGLVTVNVTSCTNTTPPCGVCSYTGPTQNAVGEIQNQRCSLDSSVRCTSNADCSGVGTCKFFFGTYLPLAAGGVSTCVENTFNGALTGTADVDNGSSAGTAALISRVFSGPTLSQPCPQCNGDATPNDGVLGGSCVGSGLKPAGTACDANGSSPNAAFGTTSLDCPPNSGGVIGTLPIDLSNTTGTKTRALTSASPSCRAIGFTSLKCQCDTCNNAAATPCSTNENCTAVGATICGGRRCSGGANNGTPCTNNTECPGGACNVPGQATAPNACDDAVCTPDPNTPGPNDGVCANGPFEQFCSPVETFRGCTSNTDCTFAGDTCSLGKLRDCFDSGIVNVDVVTATGNADPPVNHQSDPTLAALFCIGPTSSSAVNGAAGLPGLGRLELTGHAVENGTP